MQLLGGCRQCAVELQKLPLHGPLAVWGKGHVQIVLQNAPLPFCEEAPPCGDSGNHALIGAQDKQNFRFRPSNGIHGAELYGIQHRRDGP